MDSPPEIRVESSPGALRRVAAPRRQPAREACEAVERLEQEVALLRGQLEWIWQQVEVLRDRIPE